LWPTTKRDPREYPRRLVHADFQVLSRDGIGGISDRAVLPATRGCSCLIASGGLIDCRTIRGIIEDAQDGDVCGRGDCGGLVDLGRHSAIISFKHPPWDRHVRAPLCRRNGAETCWGTDGTSRDVLARRLIHAQFLGSSIIFYLIRGPVRPGPGRAGGAKIPPLIVIDRRGRCRSFGGWGPTSEFPARARDRTSDHRRL